MKHKCAKKMNCLVNMVTALALTRHFLSVPRSSLVASGWSSSAFFVPSKSRSRLALLGSPSPIRNRRTRRNLKSSLVMWGEEDAPTHVTEIPSSRNYSADSQQRRPARRSRRSSGGWDNHDDDHGGGWEEEYRPRQQRQPARRNNNRGSNAGWDDDNVEEEYGRSSRASNSGWDGYDDAGDYNSFEPYTYNSSPSRNRGRGSRDSYRRSGERGGRGRGGRGSGRGDRQGRGDRGGRGRGSNHALQKGKASDGENKAGSVKINLKLLENAGYEHLYGIAPVLNSLKANERNFANPDDDEKEDLNDLLDLQERLATVDGIDDDFSQALADEFEDNKEDKRVIKPEAKLAPYLFIQEGTLDNTKRSFRSDAKVQASSEIVALAREHGVPIAEVDKGVLNTLCGSRPHQGFVLRCGGLSFEPMRSIPTAGDDTNNYPNVWLALDEVVDPMNLGALLRSIYFLGGGERVGVVVTAKNSSPLSPAVSAASSGALEFMTVYSTSNLPKLLHNAKDSGWSVLGAAAEAPGTKNDKRSDNSATVNDWDIGGEDDANIVSNQRGEMQLLCYDLYNVETNKPTILVLGSEGRGLRTLVGRACTSFVKIPGGAPITDEDDGSQAGVDSLNVSVTGGILLWHFLSGSRKS